MPAVYPRKWQAFIGIALLSFGCYLDYTVVNVALPTIQQELKSDLTSLQWVMNIYFLALCILATIMGRCGDLFGRRRLFYIGAVIFALASVLAGIAHQIQWLIVGRLFQGVGAAIVFPLGPSLLPSIFPPREQGKVIGWLGSLGGIALALGPVLGGFIVVYWGWRWIFFINIPLTLLGFLFCVRSIAESKAESSQSALDWQGMGLLAIAMCGIVLSVIRSATAGWTDATTLTLLAVGILAGGILIRIEKRKEDPLIDFKDFLKRLFYAGAVLSCLSGVLSAIVLFFDPLYLQVIRGESPQLSGMVLFAIPMTVLIIALLVGWLIEVFGMIKTIIMGLLMGASAGLISIFFTETTPMMIVILAFICLGGMWAMGNTVSIIAAQTAAGPARISSATGTMVTTFNIGGSIGLALGIMIYHFSSFTVLPAFLKEFSLDSTTLKHLYILLSNPTRATEIDMTSLTHQLFHRAFLHGYAWVMAFLCIICIIAAFSIVVWKNDQGQGHARQ